MSAPDPIAALRESRAVALAREDLEAFRRFASGEDVAGDWAMWSGRLANSLTGVLTAIDAAGGES